MTLINITRGKECENFLKDNEVVMVYASLTYCVPCKRIFPEFEKLTEKYTNISFCKIVLNELDDECQTYVKDKFKLTKFPSFTLLNNGIILDSVIGPHLDKVVSILDCIGIENGDEEVEF